MIVKVNAFEAPPPGAGLNTLTDAAPGSAMSAAGIAAVNCVALIYVVTRSEPFHLTTDPLIKLAPLTVRVNADPPAVALEGFRLVRPGTALSGVAET